VRYGVSAERNGLDAVWASDHFHPWYDTNGHGGFSWEILSAIGALTENTILGTSITCPLFRYPPPIVAQAFATLASLFPGRVFLGVGTGEALNEIPCGFEWPTHGERVERLKEAIVIIRMLWNRNFVTHSGRFYRLSKANIYDKPNPPIPIHVASTGVRGAEVAGMLGDSFMSLPVEDTSLFTEKLFPALDKGARFVGRRADQIEKSLLVHVGYWKNDREKALNSLRLWRSTLLPVFFDLGVSDPRYMEAHGSRVSWEAVEKNFLVASTREDIIRFYENYIKIGFTHIAAAPSGDAECFLQLFGQEVSPYIQETYGDPDAKSTPYMGTYTEEDLAQYLEAVT
jgi:coenzyme F420-dependent glucose-6-phosphate dehydrogenase